MMSIDKLKTYIINKLEKELSEKLTYHGVHHTLQVFNVCGQYIDRMEIQPEDAKLLYTAAIMHDTGFIRTYDNHEEESILLAKEILPDWNYSQKDIEKIAGIIRATKIPQQPKNVLEQILADADLDYLGTEVFVPTGEKLFKELKAFNKISNKNEWNTIQINFLQKHKYHTPFAKQNREPVKQKHLKALYQL